MPKFKRKKNEISAIQYEGTTTSLAFILNIHSHDIAKIGHNIYEHLDIEFKDETKVTLKNHDWLIKEECGLFYAIPWEKFNEIFETK